MRIAAQLLAAMAIVALPTLAMAQTAVPPPSPTDIQQKAQVLQEAIGSLNAPAQTMVMSALSPYLQAQQQTILQDQKQVADLQKENADLKTQLAAAKKVPTPAVATSPAPHGPQSYPVHR